MDDLSDRAVRIEMGMSAVRAAKFAGVARSTLYVYELGRQFVAEEQRARLDRFFARLRLALASLKKLDEPLSTTPPLR